MSPREICELGPLAGWTQGRVAPLLPVLCAWPRLHRAVWVGSYQPIPMLFLTCGLCVSLTWELTSAHAQTPPQTPRVGELQSELQQGSEAAVQLINPPVCPGKPGGQALTRGPPQPCCDGPAMAQPWLHARAQESVLLSPERSSHPCFPPPQRVPRDCSCWA